MLLTPVSCAAYRPLRPQPSPLLAVGQGVGLGQQAQLLGCTETSACTFLKSRIGLDFDGGGVAVAMDVLQQCRPKFIDKNRGKLLGHTLTRRVR